MTAEQIQDALTLLNADLIAEADKKRHKPPQIRIWKRFAVAAACFALVLCCGFYCARNFIGMGGSSMEKAAAEVPMIQAEQDSNSLRTETATQAAAPKEGSAEEEPAADSEDVCGLPTAPDDAPSDTSGSGTTNSSLQIDHAHHPAESAENRKPTAGWCGNTTATIHLDGIVHTLSGEDAITLTDILIHLSYDPAQLCRCMAEFTADTELGTGYEISLTEYFVRHEGGQAALTIAQADMIQEIIMNLGG